jgi:pimeloyl-ACP methyl ester carboxylesterase
MAAPGVKPFVAGSNPALHGERAGEGPAVVLCHGLTATRGQIVHGSKVLPRRGHMTIAYDARGHGESDPAPAQEGYGYPRLAADLERVADSEVGEDAFALAGHSMGAHTAIAFALEQPQRVAGLILIGPVYRGLITEEGMEYWDGLAEGLEHGGVDGFLAALERGGLDPSWRDTVLRFTRQRMEAHQHPEAVAAALREVPRSRPFESMDELEFLDIPALVVASHDVADPGHPRAVAEAYAERLPQARLASEAEGESPLAWQGGKLSREIAAFCEEPAVMERLPH